MADFLYIGLSDCQSVQLFLYARLISLSLSLPLSRFSPSLPLSSLPLSLFHILPFTLSHPPPPAPPHVSPFSPPPSLQRILIVTSSTTSPHTNIYISKDYGKTYEKKDLTLADGKRPSIVYFGHSEVNPKKVNLCLHQALSKQLLVTRQTTSLQKYVSKHAKVSLVWPKRSSQNQHNEEICSISSRSRVLAHRPCPKLEMFCPSVLQLFYGCSKVLMTNHGMSFFVFVFLFFKPAGDPSSATLVPDLANQDKLFFIPSLLPLF